MLYLIATPIGNLEDISLRALATLKIVDYILCEDTRHTRGLLERHGIDKPLLSYHQFNEKEREERICQDLRDGKSVALVSDAGTPLISDPGQVIASACIQAGLPFTAIPGPCSPVMALLLSGFDASRFQFIGFLPREQGVLREALRRALYYRGTTIAFESAQRLIHTLEEIVRIDPKREVAVARELTKMYEECLRNSAEELLKHFEKTAPRGEIVLLIREGKPPEEDLSIEELVGLLQEANGLSLKEAIRAAAILLGLPKKTVYKQIHS